MRRVLALVLGALLSVMMIGSVSAQTPGVTIILPAGPTSTVQATVAGQVCGTATMTPSNLTTLTLDATNVVCLTPGALINFTSNGVPLIATLNVPATGEGVLNLEDFSPTVPVTITIPAVPGGSGSVTALLNGEACATVVVSATATTTLALPAACTVANSVITFQGAGDAALTSTLTVPAVGGGVLTLPALTAANPVTATVPAGTGTLSVFINGNACGVLTLNAAATTSLVLPVTCAGPGETVMFLTEAGIQLAALPVIPALGGTLTVANLNPAVVRVTLPAGPEGVITARVNGEVCGVASTSPLGTRTLTMLGTCSFPGADITLAAGDGIALDSVLTIPSIITTTALVLGDLDAATPVMVRLPIGTGVVDVIVGTNVCATVTLSTTTTVTVELPATCIASGATITFEVDGELVDQTGTIPVSASGTVVITDLGDPVVVPAPADTGNYGSFATEEGTSPALIPVAALALAALMAAGVAVRRRTE
jgi:hypothetical protein